MKSSTLFKGWTVVSVAVTLLTLHYQIGWGDADKGAAQDDWRKTTTPVPAESTSVKTGEVKQVEEVGVSKAIKPEYRGEPGGWKGECPMHHPGLGIHYLRPTIPQAKIVPSKDWTAWKIPKEIEEEHNDMARYELPSGGWRSKAVRMGKQWYHLTNFCIKDGRITLFDPGMGVATNDSAKISQRKKRFNLYNEFTRHSNKLSYHIESVPYKLPGPLVDNPAWILSFWCQDLFHSTLTLMPAHAIKKWANPDIYISISKPKSPCHQKLGSPLSWDDSYNPFWGNDKQFSYAGNPYWRMYRVITDEPWRVRPLGKHGYYNGKARCYKEGFLDKKWFIEITRQEAIDYANHHLRNFGIERTRRTCRKEGGYRMTLINRQGSTRKLANIQEVAEAAMCHGFNVTVVAFERFDLKEQIEVIANTDLLLGMHGNGLIWTMFQEIGGYEIEIMGSWYERYAHLWGNGYSNTNTFDKFGKKGNEWYPFNADMAQVSTAFAKAKKHLDATSCDNAPLPSMTENHRSVWEAILIRNHPELALPANQRAEYLRNKKKMQQESDDKASESDRASESSGV